jgi:hypothetical protein
MLFYDIYTDGGQPTGEGRRLPPGFHFDANQRAVWEFEEEVDLSLLPSVDPLHGTV